MENQENLNGANGDKQNKYELHKQEKELAQKKRNSSRLLKRSALWVVVFLIVGASAWGVVKVVQAPRVPGNNTAATILNTVNEHDWIIGNKDSKIILVEYSDLQCPACAAYNPFVKQIVEEYKDRIQYTYRHFPLEQHKNSKIAAYAAEAAGRQGKFYEMVDVLFEKQPKWESESNAKAIELFTSYADGMGLNIEQFKKDSESQDVKDRVQKDYNEGYTAGIDHTPTFFVNGKEIKNPQSAEEFKNILEQALQ